MNGSVDSLGLGHWLTDTYSVWFGGQIVNVSMDRF